MGALESEPPWFYTPEWQDGMQEADEDLAAERFTRYHSDEEFLASFAEPPAPKTIASLGWTREQAADLRWRLQSFAEDWERPDMDVYDAL